MPTLHIGLRKPNLSLYEEYYGQTSQLYMNVMWLLLMVPSANEVKTGDTVDVDVVVEN